MKDEPRAFFECPVEALTGKQLAATLFARLRGEGESVRMLPQFLLPNWLVAKSKDKDYFVSVKRHHDGIEVVVHSWNISGPLAKVFGRKPKDFEGLHRLTEKVHAVLAAIPQAVDLRWYQKGSATSVATPGELWE
jgi:hypothetical protein